MEFRQALTDAQKQTLRNVPQALGDVALDADVVRQLRMLGYVEQKQGGLGLTRRGEEAKARLGRGPLSR